MTVSQLLKTARTVLQDAGIENASAEARWLLESLQGVTREFIVLNPEGTVPCADEYLELIERRKNGEPIQYILGEWDFCGESFAVGEGVLVPRPETELLVDFACDYLKQNPKATVVDLCSGSGCVGLSVAKRNPCSRIYMIEKYPAALKYLRLNESRFACPNASVLQGDIFDGIAQLDIPSPQLILSNPPYIPAREIPLLDREVRLEPETALDGGEDGLDFYRAIASVWLPAMQSGSAVAVECGENQASEVADIFRNSCDKISVINDFNNIGRIVTALVKGQ